MKKLNEFEVEANILDEDPINKKKSALAKLKKLGLDEDEIKSLF